MAVELHAAEKAPAVETANVAAAAAEPAVRRLASAPASHRDYTSAAAAPAVECRPFGPAVAVADTKTGEATADEPSTRFRRERSTADAENAAVEIIERLVVGIELLGLRPVVGPPA